MAAFGAANSMSETENHPTSSDRLNDEWLLYVGLPLCRECEEEGVFLPSCVKYLPLNPMIRGFSMDGPQP